MYAALGLICIGLLGASLFGTGMIFDIQPLVITGICLTVLEIIGIIIFHICTKKSHSQLQTQSMSPNPVNYSTNNMNSMKRNKSDTNLELINRQGEDI
jgi:hypothetical protein